MRITPRYEGAAVINVDAVVRSPSAALVRQRARLAEALRGLTPGNGTRPVGVADGPSRTSSGIWPG
jgi:hypothetical protein